MKRRALQFGIARSRSRKLSRTTPEFRAQLAGLKPDVIVIVGYGRIVPQWMLDLPPLGNINLHASLLPKYRGAAPIQWAIARGESITGVTTMKIDAGLDTGDILLQRELPIAPNDTTEMLGPKLATMGADLIVETLRGLQAHDIQPRLARSRASVRSRPILKKRKTASSISPARPRNH